MHKHVKRNITEQQKMSRERDRDRERERQREIKRKHAIMISNLTPTELIDPPPPPLFPWPLVHKRAVILGGIALVLYRIAPNYLSYIIFGAVSLFFYFLNPVANKHREKMDEYNHEYRPD
ncbi:hypothetical protein DFA_01415 [Cavenderia fasciculata]|uniref:Uncharacterized protein n=1 Tax=Cavenderia fasciculata TaxID=261658 RepID=F4PSQ1_CACFS|nr:uncharacterized protein DFA_01415 [Cavenderia fasciculata]EGG21529.1 hypothetical protein DFA_01415 [Cavenderia fasciculata]|eukprot:XP_004359379.1 hypothetical protein DFA_01415 [Cavenderia fasciculata]